MSIFKQTTGKSFAVFVDKTGAARQGENFAGLRKKIDSPVIEH
jgi:hypothetical protein